MGEHAVSSILENFRDETCASYANGSIFGKKWQPVVGRRCKVELPYAMLSPVLLKRLRLWWCVARAQGKVLDGGWLFPGLDPLQSLSTRQLNRAQTPITIAADAKNMGAQIAATLVLHTWGSALTHHPHVHVIVPGGGLSKDGERWVACRPGFFLSVRVLSRLFRRRFFEELEQAHRAGQLQFYGEYAQISDASAFAKWLGPMRRCELVLYAKRPFAGPQEVLAYLSRYTHRVAIANSRLVSMDEGGVTFRWKDYRDKGKTRHNRLNVSVGMQHSCGFPAFTSF